MNAIIQELLERVQRGDLSQVEAEKQYVRLVQSQQTEDPASTFGDGRQPSIVESERARASSCEEGRFANRRIEVVKQSAEPEYRLFIFLPFGFGNETVSWVWRNAFGDRDDVEVWLFGAGGVSEWEELIGYLVEQMEPLCDVPFVVYGHSMGAIVAYETLMALKEEYQIAPSVFIPSSVAPPGIFERLKVMPPIYDIDEEMGMADVRRLLEESQVILPAKSGIKAMSDSDLKCDIELIKQYRHRHRNRGLSCSVLAIQANNDVLVKDPVTIPLWEEYTEGYFLYREVEGTHLYFLNPPKSFVGTIKAFMTGAKWFVESGFEPKTYRLVSFEAGTEEVNVYPYGVRPKGYLMYEAGGTMAAHLWNSSREARRLEWSEDRSDRSKAVERVLTYMCYSGEYEVRQGVIEHLVRASSDPKFVRENLSRFYFVHGDRMTLATAPLTSRNGTQSRTTSYSKLVWEEVKEGRDYAGHPLVGAWGLSSYENGKGHVLGESPEGVLILTKEGFWSLVAMRQNRRVPRLDNWVLATEQEIEESIESCRSYCGRFEIMGGGEIRMVIEGGVRDAAVRTRTVRWELSEQTERLRLTWDEPEGENSSMWFRERRVR